MLADPRADGAGAATSPASGCTCATCRTSRRTHDEFPDFDDDLREAFRRETELFFDSIMREDRNVLDLLTRRLHVRQRAAGEALRHPERLRQPLPPRDAARTTRAAGLLGKGSILMVTSHADRTAPVLRGKWILENLLGTPPPPPPANVPPLEPTAGAAPKTHARADGDAPREPGVRRLPPS